MRKHKPPPRRINFISHPTQQNVPHAPSRSMLCNAECPCSAPASATQPSLPIQQSEINPQSQKTQTHTTHTTQHNKISCTHIRDRCSAMQSALAAPQPAQRSLRFEYRTLKTIPNHTRLKHTPHTPHTTQQNIPHAPRRLMLCNAECPCSAPASVTQPSIPILHPENNHNH